MKKNNFGKYFIYKLSSLRGFLAASLVLALAGIPTLVTMLKIYFSLYEKEITGGTWYWAANFKYNDLAMFIDIYCAMWMILIFLASFALAVIVPVFSFSFYNNRALTDTVGSLPLTYNRRFWGDFLSGFAASVMPYLILLPNLIFLTNNMIPYSEEHSQLVREHFGYYAELPGYITRYSLMFAVILISAYAFSSLIVSLCGKKDSTAMYLIFGMLFVPGLILVYTGFLSRGIVGIDGYTAMLESISFIPPAGLMPNFLDFWNGLGNSGFSDYETFTEIPPAGYAVIFLLTVMYGAGAYFLGKYRKAERTDRDFVYEGAYAVMSTIIAVCIFGVGALFYAFTPDNMIYMIFAVVIGGVVYLALALSHTKSFKNLPKALIRYAVICAACFGFFGLAKLTDSFGISDYVPSAREISSVEIVGEYFYSYDKKALVYDDKDAVEAIVAGHKELISDKSDLQTGEEIIFTYRLKNGFVINRQYSTIGGDSIEKLSDIILGLPTSSSNVYGILDSSEDYELLSFHGNYNPANSGKGVSFEIYSSKSEEFRQILLNDIKNNYSETSYQYGGGYCGEVIAAYMKDGEWYSYHYTLYSAYEDTVAFIQNPDNCRTSQDDSNNTEPEIKSCTAKITLGNQYIEFEFYADNALGKELLALCRNETDGELSEAVSVVVVMSNGMGTKYYISKADEESAVKLILQMAENYFVQ
ncbi:MAG: hypothetical protein J1F04_02950 [Oscillospiraceae bacterium]|nr:hypothetical protein [Oscillospiraceae bacterium]